MAVIAVWAGGESAYVAAHLVADSQVREWRRFVKVLVLRRQEVEQAQGHDHGAAGRHFLPELDLLCGRHGCEPGAGARAVGGRGHPRGHVDHIKVS
jgi:hypothetical protein